MVCAEGGGAVSNGLLGRAFYTKAAPVPPLWEAPGDEPSFG